MPASFVKPLQLLNINYCKRIGNPWRFTCRGIACQNHVLEQSNPTPLSHPANYRDVCWRLSKYNQLKSVCSSGCNKMKTWVAETPDGAPWFDGWRGESVRERLLLGRRRRTSETNVRENVLETTLVSIFYYYIYSRHGPIGPWKREK